MTITLSVYRLASVETGAKDLSLCTIEYARRGNESAREHDFEGQAPGVIAVVTRQARHNVSRDGHWSPLTPLMV